MEEELHRQIRIRCADLDTIIQDSAVEMLERELSANGIQESVLSKVSCKRREKDR